MNGIPMVRALDDYLAQEVNDKSGSLVGAVDALIRRNRASLHLHGSRRLCNANFHVAQRYDGRKGQVHVRSVEKPDDAPALLYTILIYYNGLTWRTVTPLQFVLKGWGNADLGYQCYVHTVAKKPSATMDQSLPGYAQLDDGYHYAGVTGRNWLLRLREHTREMRDGTGKRFHRAWSQFFGMSEVYFSSELKDVNLSKDEAMDWEERAVDDLGPSSLNMIPGGYKGLQFLHELRITDRVDISLEDRDRAIVEYVRQHPRKGKPNPFISELWKNDDFYLKIMESRPKTLSPDQVRTIRKLAQAGRPVPEIAEEVDALNELQVRNVISGRYYGRVE